MVAKHNEFNKVKLPSKQGKRKHEQRIAKQRAYKKRIKRNAELINYRYGSGIYFDKSKEHLTTTYRGTYFTYLKKAASKKLRNGEKDKFYASNGSNYKKVFDIEWEYF